MVRGVKGIHHVAISVPDLAAAEAFYAGTLGFEVADREGNVQSTHGRDPFGNVIDVQQLEPGLDGHVGRLPRWRS